MALGDGPIDCTVPQVPAVCPSAAALHLVASGASYHQDCVVLHYLGFCQRGELTGGYKESFLNGWDLTRTYGLHAAHGSNTSR